MRRYDDPVEVRRGRVPGPGGLDAAELEGPEQFLWHGRLWKVRSVLARWVETGPWWQSAGVAAVLGTGEPDPGAGRGDGPTMATELLVERELWRVEAGSGARADTGGVFDLSYDWSDGRWQLVGCLD